MNLKLECARVEISILRRHSRTTLLDGHFMQLVSLDTVMEQTVFHLGAKR